MVKDGDENAVGGMERTNCECGNKGISRVKSEVRVCKGKKHLLACCPSVLSVKGKKLKSKLVVRE